MTGTKEVTCNQDGAFFLSWGPLGGAQQGAFGCLFRQLCHFLRPIRFLPPRVKAAAVQTSSHSSNALRKGHRGNVAKLNLDLKSVSNLVLTLNQKKIAQIKRWRMAPIMCCQMTQNGWRRTLYSILVFNFMGGSTRQLTRGGKTHAFRQWFKYLISLF